MWVEEGIGKYNSGRICNRVKVNEYPWMTLLFITILDGYKTRCGGSLIANQWVVSVAH